MNLCILASGSKGNSLFIKSGESRILVDAGLGIRSLLASLQEIGEMPERLDAIFITHEHSDHTAGLGRLLARSRTPVYASAGTMAELESCFPTRLRTGVMLGDVNVGAFSVRAIPISHDAAEPVAYVIEAENKTITVATDLGEVPEPLAEAMRHAACTVIESNHDEQLLADGPYPELLKERIRSSTGHLSNRQTADVLSTCRGNGLLHVVLAHLSEENNDPEIARLTATAALESSTAKLHLTAQRQLGPYITI